MLTFGINLGTSTDISRPFDLDLADAISELGLPDFLTSLVSVDTSGNLGVAANATAALKFGIDLDGVDKGLFVETGPSGL